MEPTTQQKNDLVELTEQTLILEKLWAQVKDDPDAAEHKPEVKAELDEVYGLLNKVLGLIVQELRYSHLQSRWEDSEPLWRMEKITPKIRETVWYNLHLSAMLGQPITLS